jgi:hypothetical protein
MGLAILTLLITTAFLIGGTLAVPLTRLPGNVDIGHVTFVGLLLRRDKYLQLLELSPVRALACVLCQQCQAFTRAFHR